MSIRDRSGEVNSDNRLVAFIYLLMRDHVPPGLVEDLMKEIQENDTYQFSNGWLANYANDVADRLHGHLMDDAGRTVTDLSASEVQR